ncbi:MAG: hypothetical protein WDN31_08810 [Hyphomicrobium sp.]
MTIATRVCNVTRRGDESNQLPGGIDAGHAHAGLHRHLGGPAHDRRTNAFAQRHPLLERRLARELGQGELLQRLGGADHRPWIEPRQLGAQLHGLLRIVGREFRVARIFVLLELAALEENRRLSAHRHGLAGQLAGERRLEPLRAEIHRKTEAGVG